MIIGLVGKAGSGKTTVTQHLTNHHKFIEYAIAKPLKDIAKILGFTDQELHGSQQDKLTLNKSLNVCSRHFMQLFGTEIMRDQLSIIFPSMDLGSSGVIWVKLLEEFIQSHPNDNIVISDVRFEDECALLKTYNAILVRIERPSPNVNVDTHTSETNLLALEVDVCVCNDGSKEDLYETISHSLM